MGSYHPSAAADLVVDCLSQSMGDLDWLGPLKVHANGQIPSKWAAIGFDTNALKHLRRVSRDVRSSILTYLQGEAIRIILPGQAVQEFWNNHTTFTSEVSSLGNQVRSLAGRFSKVTSGTEAESQLLAMAAQLRALSEEIADAENPNLLKASIELWEVLIPDATIAQIPRERVVAIGEARLTSGTAPGFADANKQINRLGDFLVWADFLMGLVSLGITGHNVPDDCIVFVSDDAKADWITAGAPHPTLLGEANFLSGRPLKIVTFAELKAEAESYR